MIYKTLSKNLDYIVFKDGHLKTKKFASFNNIKLVNPIWIDDKLTKGIFEDDDKYIIKVNQYIELIIDNYITLTKKKEKSNSFTKELELKYEDDFDVKFNNYVDSKMNTYKSQMKNQKPIKDELYYSLFDQKFRQKRKSNETNNIPKKTTITEYFFNDKKIAHKTNDLKIEVKNKNTKLCKSKSFNVLIYNLLFFIGFIFNFTCTSRYIYYFYIYFVKVI